VNRSSSILSSINEDQIDKMFSQTDHIINGEYNDWYEVFDDIEKMLTQHYPDLNVLQVKRGFSYLKSSNTLKLSMYPEDVPVDKSLLLDLISSIYHELSHHNLFRLSPNASDITTAGAFDAVFDDMYVLSIVERPAWAISASFKLLENNFTPEKVRDLGYSLRGTYSSQDEFIKKVNDITTVYDIQALLYAFANTPSRRQAGPGYVGSLERLYKILKKSYDKIKKICGKLSLYEHGIYGVTSQPKSFW